MPLLMQPKRRPRMRIILYIILSIIALPFLALKELVKKYW